MREREWSYTKLRVGGDGGKERGSLCSQNKTYAGAFWATETCLFFLKTITNICIHACIYKRQKTTYTHMATQLVRTSVHHPWSMYWWPVWEMGAMGFPPQLLPSSGETPCSRSPLFASVYNSDTHPSYSCAFSILPSPLFTVVSPNLQKSLPPSSLLPTAPSSFVHSACSSEMALVMAVIRAGPVMCLCWRKREGKHSERGCHDKEAVSGNHRNLGNHEVIFSSISNIAVSVPPSNESCLCPTFLLPLFLSEEALCGLVEFVSPTASVLSSAATTQHFSYIRKFSWGWPRNPTI